MKKFLLITSSCFIGGFLFYLFVQHVCNSVKEQEKTIYEIKWTGHSPVTVRFTDLGWSNCGRNFIATDGVSYSCIQNVEIRRIATETKVPEN